MPGTRRPRRRAPAQVPAGDALDPDDWYSIVDAETLAAQREAGYFLDLWHWRAHLSNPVGHADDQLIAWYRLYDSGQGPFFSNWDGNADSPGSCSTRPPVAPRCAGRT
jgi:hypothetical protein